MNMRSSERAWKIVALHIQKLLFFSIFLNSSGAFGGVRGAAPPEALGVYEFIKVTMSLSTQIHAANCR